MITTVSYGLNPELACVFLTVGGLIVLQMVRFKREWRAKTKAAPPRG